MLTKNYWKVLTYSLSLFTLFWYIIGNDLVSTGISEIFNLRYSQGIHILNIIFVKILQRWRKQNTSCEKIYKFVMKFWYRQGGFHYVIWKSETNQFKLNKYISIIISNNIRTKYIYSNLIDSDDVLIFSLCWWYLTNGHQWLKIKKMIQ